MGYQQRLASPIRTNIDRSLLQIFRSFFKPLNCLLCDNYSNSNFSQLNDKNDIDCCHKYTRLDFFSE